MNLLDSVQYRRKQQILGTEAALSYLGPVAATGLVMSISDIIENKKVIRHKKFLASAFKKIKTAVMIANRDRAVPNIVFDEEEDAAWSLIKSGIKAGAISAITTLAEGLFSFIPFAIEMVVAPLLSITVSTILAVLPIVLSPEGLAVLALAGSGFYLYKRWTENGGSFGSSGNEFPDVPLVGGKVSSNVPQVQISETAALGLRNNNPGNLVYAKQPGALPKNGTFAQFPDQATGLYNMARQIKLNQAHGYNTVDSMIRHWSSTDQDAYVRNVSQRLGVKPNDQIDLNNEATVVTLMEGIILQENNHQNPYSRDQLVQAARQAMGTGSVNLSPPVNGVVSSGFGHREMPTEGASTEHQGVDIAAPVGTPVYAAADGQVEVEKSSPSYGNFIQLKHDSMWTRYGHLSTFEVKQGDSVVKGQKIGEVGNTGISTGAHLHFETQPFTARSPVDPSSYLPELSKGQKVTTGGGSMTPPKDVVAINRGGTVVTLGN